MTISEGDTLKMQSVMLFPTGDRFLNVWYARLASIGSAEQSDIRAAAANYVEAILEATAADWNSLVVSVEVEIFRRDTVLNQFISEGTEVIAVGGGQSGGAFPGSVAGSMTARTNVPRRQGRKRISGYDEDSGVRGLLAGGPLGRLAVAATLWILGFEVAALNLVLESGVFSELANVFTDFNGSGLVKNVMGTQTTRKALRGS